MAKYLPPLVTDEEVEAALIGLGFSRVAATTRAEVSESDLRTDMRSALQQFLIRASS